MNNANKFVVFNIKIKKTISQELFFAGSSYRTPFIKLFKQSNKDQTYERMEGEITNSNEPDIS